MLTCKEATQRLYLGQYRPGSSARSRTIGRKAAALANVAVQREAARHAELGQLMNDLRESLWELDSSPASKHLEEESCQPNANVLGSPSVLKENSKPPKRSPCEPDPLFEKHAESEQRPECGKVAGLPASCVNMTVFEDDWLDLEDLLHTEDSWLLEANGSIVEEEGAAEGLVEEGCTEASATSGSCGKVQEGKALVEGVEDTFNDVVVKRDVPTGGNFSQSSREWPQLHRFAQEIITSQQRKKGASKLHDVKTVCNGLLKLKAVRLAQVRALQSRASDLEARTRSVSQSGKGSGAGTLAAVKQSVEQRTAEPEERLSHEDPAAGEGGGAEIGERKGLPGWLSLESIAALAQRVSRLEAALAAMCQEMVGHLVVRWDELRIPLESRQAFEEEMMGLDVVVRSERLERKLVQAQHEAAMLQPVTLLCQQRDDLRREVESQDAMYREVSKQLLSRKVDGASALRKAEAERKRLLREQSKVQKHLNEAIRVWEMQAGRQFDEKRYWEGHMQLRTDREEKDSGTPTQSRESPWSIRKGCRTETAKSVGYHSSDEILLCPLPGNIY